jgi:photosystem II stability/assembly factor-like uncharacterized protein
MATSRVLAAGLVLALFPTLAFAGPPVTWTPRGIGGGGAMYAPTINPANPREMAIGCDMSPQFTSVNAGKTWSLIDFRQLQSGHECAIRYTRDPKIRWTIGFSTSGGDDRVRPARSVDGGKTWYSPPERAWPAARIAYILYADYDNPDRAVISADYGELWITLDGGRTFAKKITAFDKDVGLHLAGAFFDGNTIYLGLNDGLYISNDGGGTFQKSKIPGMLGLDFITSFAGGKSGGKLRLACVAHRKGWPGMTGADLEDYAGVYVLDPDAKTWQLKTAGIPESAAMFFVRMAANDADTIYVAGGSGGSLPAPIVCKSTDGGGSWTNVFQAVGNRNIAAGWARDGGDFGWSFPEYALGFEVDSLDKNHLLLTDLGCAHASDDGGKSWRQVYTTPAAQPATGLFPKGQAYSSNGLEVTSIWQIHWFDPTNVFACATDIRGFRSTDAGNTWAFNYTGDTFNSMYRVATDPASRVTYAAVSSVHDIYQSTYLADKKIDHGKGAVLATSDNGATWQPVGHLDKPVVWVTVDPKHSGTVYASVAHSQDGGIYVTHDAAKGKEARWTKLAAPPRTQGHAYNIHDLSDGTLLCTFAGRRLGNKSFTESSGVFLSTDGGKSWEDRTDFRMRFWTKDVVLDPADKTDSTWYAGTFLAWGKSARDSEAGLYRTTDRGKTWTQLATSPLAKSGVLNVESCAFDPAHPGQFYFTTEYDGLFYCPDIRAKNPAFTQVESYGFKHPLRVQFNPQKPTEMWVTSFGNGIRVGKTTP